MKCQIRPDPHRFLEEGFKYILIDFRHDFNAIIDNV